MEFDKSRVYTALNADELRAGDKIICANDMGHLKHYVINNGDVLELQSILDENNRSRFVAGTGKVLFNLAYLIERKENCTNCGKHEDCGFIQNQSRFANLNKCENWKPIAEKKAEKHYRPFRDVCELIKVWEEKTGATPYWGKGADLFMPHIWIKYKYNEKSKGSLITDFSDDQVALGDKEEDYMTMCDLFDNYTFLDGSPCGMKE